MYKTSASILLPKPTKEPGIRRCGLRHKHSDLNCNPSYCPSRSNLSQADLSSSDRNSQTVASALEEAPTRQVVTELRGHTDQINACCVFVGNTKVLSASNDTTLRVWDLESGKELGQVGV